MKEGEGTVDIIIIPCQNYSNKKQVSALASGKLKRIRKLIKYYWYW